MMSKKETKIEITDKAEPPKGEPGKGENTISGDDAPDESSVSDVENDQYLKTDQESNNEPVPDEQPDFESDEESGEELGDLHAAKKDARESYDRFLRLSAEFDNYKKRAAREAAEFKKFANETLVREILPIIDNLERAIESSDRESQEKNGLVEGVDMTLKEMLKVFDKFHVKPIDAVGEPFDPCFHQAVIQEESSDYPENTVIKELQRGYMMHDRLIRPAMVVVSSSTPGKGSEANGSCQEKAEE